MRSIIRGRRRRHESTTEARRHGEKLFHVLIVESRLLNNRRSPEVAFLRVSVPPWWIRLWDHPVKHQRTTVELATDDFLRHLRERNASLHTIKAYAGDLDSF